MKVAAGKKNIKRNQLFSKQQTFGVGVTIVQWKISVDLKRSCF